MIRILSLSILAFGLMILPAAAQDETVAPTGLVEIQRVVSPGGIEAWLVQDDFVPIISVRIGFYGGSQYDEMGKEGTARLSSWLYDEGAGELSSAQFQNRMEEYAIRMGFSASRDRFNASMSTLSENSDEAFDMLRMALTEPRFEQDAIERMRRSLLSSIAQGERDPNSIASRVWWENAFPGHSYGAHATRESVEAITVEDIRAAHGHLNRRDMRIGVAGDISARELGRLLDETFGDLPEGRNAYEPRQVSPSGGGELIVVNSPVPQSVVIFGSGGIDYNDPDYMAAMVMNSILGGGNFASRLMSVVREEHGLAYYVNSSLAVLDGASIYQGRVGTENARVSESIALIRSEIARLRDDGVTAEELQNTQRYLTGAFALGFGSNSSIASRLAFYQMEELGIDYINTRNASIEAVTQEDIARAAERLLDPDNLLVVVVGQPEGLEATSEQ